MVVEKYCYTKKNDFGEDIIITNEELIPFSSLEKRWKGATPYEIKGLADTGKMVCFHRQKTIFKGEDKEHYLKLHGNLYFDYDFEGYRYVEDVIILLRDVEEIEREHPDFLCSQVPVEDLEKDILSPPCPSCSDFQRRIAELNSQLVESQKRIVELETRLEEVSCQARKAINTPQQVVTVDAALWEDSCKAMGKVLVEVIENGETVQKDSKDLSVKTLKTRLKDASERKRIHSKVDAIAWEVLPEKYRNGPGRSSKE